MKKAWKIFVVFVLMVCLLRATLRASSDSHFVDTNFDIVPKIEHFVKADVFNFDQELISLQACRWYFNSFVNYFSAREGDLYAYYEVYDQGVIPPAMDYIPIYGTNPDLDEQGQPIAAKMVCVFYGAKGAGGFLEQVSDIWNITVPFVWAIFKFIGSFLMHSFVTLVNLILLFLDIIFDVGTPIGA